MFWFLSCCRVVFLLVLSVPVDFRWKGKVCPCAGVVDAWQGGLGLWLFVVVGRSIPLLSLENSFPSLLHNGVCRGEVVVCFSCGGSS